jgi:hydroxyacylglutathione hydrolase
MLKIETIKVTSFEQNCRVLYDDKSPGAIVVDPGGDVERIIGCLGDIGKTCEEIWLTHSHLDHAGGVSSLKNEFGCPVVGHRAGQPIRESIAAIAQMYGASGFENCPEPDLYVEHGDVLKKLGLEWKVLFTPGHDPGHVCFYCESEGVLLCGDTVFAGSIGRTDLPGGDLKTLLYAIRDNILVLPDGVRLLNGHGPETTVGRERHENPFLSGRL